MTKTTSNFDQKMFYENLSKNGCIDLAQFVDQKKLLKIVPKNVLKSIDALLAVGVAHIDGTVLLMKNSDTNQFIPTAMGVDPATQEEDYSVITETAVVEDTVQHKSKRLKTPVSSTQVEVDPLMIAIQLAQQSGSEDIEEEFPEDRKEEEEKEEEGKDYSKYYEYVELEGGIKVKKYDKPIKSMTFSEMYERGIDDTSPEANGGILDYAENKKTKERDPIYMDGFNKQGEIARQ